MLQSLNAEQSIISGILQHGKDGFIEVEDILDPDFISDETNKVLYLCIKAYYSNNSGQVDIPSIISAASDIGYKHYITKDIKDFLRKLQNEKVELENLRGESIRIAKLAIARKLQTEMIVAKKELESITGLESLAEIFAIPESKILDLSKFIDKNERPTSLIGEGGLEWITDIMDNPRETIGISSGFPIYDACIGGGFRRGTTHIIAARAKSGKTTIVDNIGKHVADVLKIPVLNLDTEMSKHEHLARLYANMTGIPINNIERGKVSLEERNKIILAAKHLANLPYHYRSVSGCPFHEILAIIKRWILKDVGIGPDGKTNDCLVIYDYFKMMDTNEMVKMQEYQALGFQLQSLNDFAKRYDFPCLSFGQTNRDGLNDETLASIAGSDRLSWFAASVSIFKKKEPEEIAQDGPNNGNRKLRPLVARHGSALDDSYIHYDLKGEFCQLKEIGLLQKSNTEEFEIEENEDV